MPVSLPLSSAERLFAVGSGAGDRADFHAAARQFAQQLPATGPIVNLCAARRSFALTLVAGAICGRPSLLPWSPSANVVRDVAAAHVAAVVVADETLPDLGALQCCRAPDPGAITDNTGSAAPVTLDPAQVAVVAFTSGSTGAPQAHAKTWGTLAASSQRLAQRVLDGLVAAQLVATVPPQHVFGLETTILLPLFSDCACLDARPLFPADVRAALESVAAPRVLVTTPVHLRALLAADVQLPPLARIVSATAPLAPPLAAAAEARFAAPVLEIYGSTESGAIASRRTAEDTAWTPLPDVRFASVEDGAEVSAPYLPQPIRLSDRIECMADGRIRLLGRSADLIKVAGRRISAADLTQRLLAVPGVEDAIVIVPEPDQIDGRPAALVVAPDMDEAAILAALATQVDAVFLPRPLRKVAALPRNAVGKLPRSALLELLRG
ncbi:acyl-CoA synthetase [Sinimarinibacterium sp. CAU 1509]|uniref:AMP-binding protein n=1 Tax=Sinimarinibacterium sp. CAU 1509 TaxID=2562283 RepID=UPI0010ACA233|nr:AMP-binding protein [Sinimarinibacterium sp. CAU 1509]TJY58299.1 acyl-CoA synthetase [Sinimarinibacterium sp. CAU 1509]